MAQLYAGTSGFAYPKWKPAFYPADLPEKKFLEYYSIRLNSVEINYTFRRMPAASTLETWVNSTRSGFLFSLKAHMRITHVLRLKNATEATETFLRAIDPLRASRRLGAVLFQLPPQFKCDAGILAEFLSFLPRGMRYAFEFRDASWLQDSVYQLLEKQNACLCVAESERFEVPEVITTDFVYYRLRKPDYSAEDLHEISENAKGLLAKGKDLFLFFKHEDTPDGALNAERILLKQ